jgi:hypothetical protein
MAMMSMNTTSIVAMSKKRKRCTGRKSSGIVSSGRSSTSNSRRRPSRAALARHSPAVASAYRDAAPWGQLLPEVSSGPGEDAGYLVSAMRTARYWDSAYQRDGTGVSWFQSEAQPSLRAFEAAGVTSRDSVIDVGGGGSPLAAALLARGQSDITVLDISATGLRAAQQRLGADAGRVCWLVADLRTWRPERTWKVWHDRAVLHFFTAPKSRAQYVQRLTAATSPGSVAVLATFAPDGPRTCSGLPVDRYDAVQLATLLGSRWRPLADKREEHVTPSGATQPFTWTTFLRTG